MVIRCTDSLRPTEGPFSQSLAPLFRDCAQQIGLFTIILIIFILFFACFINFICYVRYHMVSLRAFMLIV